MSVPTPAQFDTFLQQHGVSLMGSGLPESLHRRLYSKLVAEVFDAGEYFEFRRHGETGANSLVISRPLDKHADVFLIDHAWSFRLRDARQQVNRFLFAGK